MILAHHIIFTAYGFWLPNDPRGSWSTMIRSWELLRFGPATKVTTHKSVAHRTHNHSTRLAAKQSLRYPPVQFTGAQALAISRGFQSAITRSNFILHACAILPEHVHLVVARHPKIHAKQILNQLKGEATKSLAIQNLHPFQTTFLPSGNRHTPWTEKGWTVFLNTPEEIYHAINYVKQNPTRENLRPQNWSFITPYPSNPSAPSATNF